MSRSAFKVILSCVLVNVLFCIAYGAPKQKKTDIFCIGDSIILGNKGSQIYSNTLQMLLDKEYGANKFSVYNYSFFDMNTTQCLQLINDLLSKPDNNEKFIIITAGEANYYNPGGFTDYLASEEKYVPQSAFIDGSDIDAVKKLNTGVASMYGSPAVHSDKASLYYTFSMAYRSITGHSPKKIEGYSPKIIPSFLVLSEDSVPNMVSGDSFNARYKLAWEFINSKRYNEAETILKEMLRTKFLDPALYYALGSLYLMDSGNLRINEALKMFEDGILLSPFDKTNQCYKGLSVMYMSYDGKIIAEVLYFSRVMKSYLGERIPEINSITAINTADNYIKENMVREWIISDIKKIDKLCKSKNARLFVTDYPIDSKVNGFLSNTLSFGAIEFIDNKFVSKNADPSRENSIYEETAKNVMEAINKQMKK
ncbi:MAG: hypothetical protein LBL00_03960 [Endomicrobium sp.]|jgi:hypothetical protein|nr:hypothetical protein [Endomicrobium sp.]